MRTFDIASDTLLLLPYETFMFWRNILQLFLFCCCCKFWDIQYISLSDSQEWKQRWMRSTDACCHSPLSTSNYCLCSYFVLLCLKVLTNYTKRVHVQQELKGRGGRTCLLLPCTGWEKDREKGTVIDVWNLISSTWWELICVKHRIFLSSTLCR